MPIASPIDVQLNCDDKTMVQPDVLVVCDREKVIRRCIYGAPDFIIEILSLTSRKKDMFTKLAKYKEAGVREYWLVDPLIYGFDSKVPVMIFGGECEIDFAEIYEYISFLY